MKSYTKNRFKRFIACILALSLIVSLGITNITSSVQAETVSDVWNGQSELLTEGEGIESNPYRISTAGQLYTAAKQTGNANVYYELTNDIYINGNENTDWSTVDWVNGTLEGKALNEWFSRWGNDANNQFNGIFNGNGYTVYGLYSKDTGATSAGGTRKALFPVLGPTAVIKYINISRASVYANYSAGAIAAETTKTDSSKASVSGCYADETVTIKGYSYAGGMVGVGQMVDFSNCGFTGTAVTQTGSNASGIMGNAWSCGTMYNCYSKGYQLAANMNQFWPRSNNYSTASNTTYADTDIILTADQMKGTDAISNMAFDRLDWDFRYNGYPTPCVRAEGYADGTGEENKPYIIENEAQLKLLINDTETAGKYYKLAKNIVVNDSLEGTPKLWFTRTYDSSGNAEGATFEGNFDGDGYTVSGLYYNGAATGGNAYWCSLGLFPRVELTAGISNVGLINSSLTLNNNGAVGGIVGVLKHDSAENTMKIESCFVGETVSISGSGSAAIGGIAGRLVGSAKIVDSYFLGKLPEGKNTATFASAWGQTRTVERFYTTSGIITTSDVYYNAVYSTVNSVTSSTTNGGSTNQVELTQLIGKNALSTLSSGFDFTTTWRISDNTPVLRIFYEREREANGIWSGAVADSYADGDGSEATPYKIANGEQLAKLAKDTDTAGKYYVLVKDIKLNDVTDENWTASLNSNTWYTVYNSDILFKGNLNGCGHTVSGLYYNATAVTDGHRSGLLPVIGAGAVITNISFEKSEMSVGCYGGTVAGYSDVKAGEVFPEISYINVEESVNIKGSVIGGIVGGGTVADFDNCCFTGTLTGATDTAKANGIVGNFWGVGDSVYYNITNCYSYDYAPYNTANALAKCKNVYSGAAAYGAVTKTSEAVKADAMNQLPNLNWKDVWTWEKGDLPYLKLNESGVYSTYALGDTDCSLTDLDAADLTVMRKHLLGSDFAYNADVTEDGIVDIVDLVGLKILASAN